MSTSFRLREEGNSVFKSVTDGLSPTDKKSRLTKARNIYNKALNMSDGTKDDKSSAAKNIAMCEWRLAVVTSGSNDSPSLVIHNYLEAHKYFKESMSLGEGEKSSEWMSKMSDLIHRCFADLEKYAMNFDAKQRVLVMQKVVPMISGLDITATINFSIAQAHFHTGIKALEENDYKTCLYQMAETHFPINECERLSKSPEFLSEVVVLQEDVRMHTCIAESVQARTTGDSLLQKVLKDLESLNIDMVWEIIDWYRNAMLLTRDLDMEAEAIAASRLGRVYDKVLKLKFQARTYHKQSISLAESMHPRTFNSCDWYKESVATLKRYQEETVMHEQEQEAKEKEKYKEELKEEFAELKTKHEKSDHVEFLKFVYEKFPPKNPQNKLPAEIDAKDSTAVKKLLQTAVVHYHPDRADPETNGMKWKVLSEQITKYFTSRYELTKSCS